MAKEDVTTLDALTLDGRNFNRHTEQGMNLLEKSLRELGAGRSILVDKDNNIIAGNGIVEAAGKAGITRVRMVVVQGDELVAVKRTDMSLDSREGRQMALADNATAAADLSWDTDTLQEVADEFDIDTEEWGVELQFQDEIMENDETSTSKNVNTLKFKGYEIPLTDDELDWLIAEAKVYSEKYSTYYGFVNWLKDGMD